MHTFTIDDAGLHFDDRTVPYDTIERVTVRTTADGPWFDDVFWCVATREHVWELPGRHVDGDALGLLQKHLTGLDDAAIIEAMGSTDDARFTIYDRLGPAIEPSSLRARFDSLVTGLGGAAADAQWDRLFAAWSEPHRAYHSTRHLAECLAAVDHFASAFGDTRVVALALWFHDAVYDARATDNEERSAAWLLEFAHASGLPKHVGERAAALVRSTAHLSGSALSGEDAALVHDVDLSILGADPLRFFEYERAIREEYRHVGGFRFALGRGAFLDRLLASDAIFRTAVFRDTFEARARENIARALRRSIYRPYRWTRTIRRMRPVTGGGR